MCAPIAIALAVASAAVSAYGQIQQGNAAAAVGKRNQRMAEISAQDAQRRGEEEAMRVQRQAGGMKSAQRSAQAGAGIDVGYGTAADIQDQTDFFGDWDVKTARYNADLDSWTARSGGQLSRFEGQAARTNSRYQAAGTLLSGASKAASKWGSAK